MLGGKGEAHHVADVVRDEIDLLDPERAASTPATSPAWVFLSNPLLGLEERPKPLRSGTMTVWSRARSTASGTRHVAGLAITVQQHHRRTRAANTRMDGDTVGDNVLRLEATRKHEARHLHLHGGEVTSFLPPHH